MTLLRASPWARIQTKPSFTQLRLIDLRAGSAYIQSTTKLPECRAMTSEFSPTDEIPLTEDDDAYDETEDENEVPVRETDDATELPEEMEYDDEDDLPHPEDDDADEEDIG